MYYRMFPHLTHLNQNSTTIEASALISIDGLVMASTLVDDEDSIGAISAAMLSLASHGMSTVLGGSLEQMLIKGKRGNILMTLIDKELILTVMAKPNAKLEQLFLEKQHYIEKLLTLI